MMFIKIGEVTWWYWMIFIFHFLHLFLCKFRLRKQINGLQKNFGGIPLFICWISLQPQPQNEYKKVQKLYFVLTELFGYFTSFNFGLKSFLKIPQKPADDDLYRNFF